MVALGRGHVLLDGTPEDVFAQPDTLATTLVRPPSGARIGAAPGIAPPPLGTGELLDPITTGAGPAPAAVEI